MKSKVTHAVAVVEGSTSTVPLTSPKLPRVLFFARTVLTQNQAQAINFKFPAMASPSQGIFLILMHIRLPAHERASGRSQSGGIHISGLDRLANWALAGPAASEHLPQAVASV